MIPRRARASLHPGLCFHCHGAGVEAPRELGLGILYCPACRGLGVRA